jgi:hypothetical protein
LEESKISDNGTEGFEVVGFELPHPRQQFYAGNVVYSR